MKKNWKLILGVFFLLGIFGGGDVSTTLLSLAIGGGLIAWWWMGRKKAAPPARQPAPIAPTKPAALVLHMPDELDGENLAYEYSVELDNADPAAFAAAGDHPLTFEVTGELITVSYEGQVLGTIPHGWDMLRDYQRRGNPVAGCVDYLKGGNWIIMGYYRSGYGLDSKASYYDGDDDDEDDDE